MPPRYTLKIVTDFASAHTLRDYPGPCSQMHGHNWKVEVQVSASQLDAAGMVMDFKLIKEAARQLCAQLDHRYLNEIPPFDHINPTAENIACHCYRELSKTLNTTRVRVSGVTIWETDRACASYSEDIE
ncbi:MAG: 6-carboxytetrahydropterin synthase QueD [Gammaproteobacteria bacterium]|nr:6-carboxytetrahydropterin synthase QueD [Gammaproteobacteria bacterium]